MKKQKPTLHPWILATLLLVGCGSKETPSTNPPATAPPPVPRVELVTKSGTLRAIVHSLPQPNAYQVALEWPAVSVDGELWILQREDDKAGLHHLATLEKKANTFTDATVAAGETYEYLLGTPEGAAFVVKDRIKLTVPLDLQITGTRSLREIRGVNRLFLAAESRLVTHGLPLSIQVNEIVAQGGVIETFAENHAAADGRDGVSPQLISIRARRGSGVLRIVARGENGGRGRPGNSGAAGAEGSPGTSGIEEAIEILPGHFLRRCVLPPGSGGAGGPGQTGGRGMDGGAGGDTPLVFTQILNPAAIQVQVIRLPGMGGKPGPGGPGGPGGAGGSPGFASIIGSGICPAAGAGPQGAAGPVGPEGGAGRVGNEQPYCLKMGNAIFGQCEHFNEAR